MGRAYNERRQFTAEMGPHTDSASSGKVSGTAKHFDQTFLKFDEEVLPETEERERHQDSCGGNSEEAAQGNILHAEQKRKL